MTSSPDRVIYSDESYCICFATSSDLIPPDDYNTMQSSRDSGHFDSDGQLQFSLFTKHLIYHEMSLFVLFGALDTKIVSLL